MGERKKEKEDEIANKTVVLKERRKDALREMIGSKTKRKSNTLKFLIQNHLLITHSTASTP